MAKRLTERKKNWIERTVDNDRSYKTIVYNRAFTSIFFVLLQLAILVAFLGLGEYGLVWQLFVGILSVAVVIYLAGRQGRHPTRMLWIILILVVPFVGLPLYLMYGDGKPAALMRRKYNQAQKKLGAPASAKGAAEPGRAGGITNALEKMGYPTYFDGEVTYYATGKEFFEAMKESLRRAKKYILMEYFIVAGGKMWSDILKLLLQKADEGVKIKIIYDDFGSILCLPPYYWSYLESLHKNIKCLTFNKVYPIFSARYNHRDHRKIFVVDGKEAFTGGVNIADEYIDEKKRFGYWKDTGIRVRGLAVESFTRTFLEIWLAFKEPKLDFAPYLQQQLKEEEESESKGLEEQDSNGKATVILPCADSPLDKLLVSETMYTEMINRATEYLYITTPYLVLDEQIRDSLCLAAMRGVDVRIVTPGIPDKKAVYRLTRANYKELLMSGVKIYEYTPGFMHAKMTLSDGYAVVGTTNYDYRSLYLHFENMVYFKDEQAIKEITKDFKEIFLVSKERKLSDVKRSVIGKIVDTILRLFEPLL